MWEGDIIPFPVYSLPVQTCSFNHARYTFGSPRVLAYRLTIAD